MKLSLLSAIFLLFAGALVSVNAQCVSDATHQCVPNDTLNRMNKALDELAASRDLIVKLTAAQATSDAKAAAAAEVIAKTNKILDLDAKAFGFYDKVVAMYQELVKLQADLNEKLMAKINAPKSAWQKFFEAVKEFAILAAGVTIGRGL